MSVFVIAEIGSTWELDLEKLKKLAHAIKDCGADAMKLQWTSSGLAMAQRRRLGEDAAAMYYKWLQYDPALLIEAKEIADSVGLEFMCSTFLVQDIAVVAPLVSRFKVSAFESGWGEFVFEHLKHQKPLIVSCNPGTAESVQRTYAKAQVLHCISRYPTPIKDLSLHWIPYQRLGLSDHSTSCLSGAVAVGLGAKVIEKHVMGFDTPTDNPDHGHSLACWAAVPAKYTAFGQYVENIREAEAML